jgi:hypothetical protein
MDTCYKRPEKYITEALKPVVELRKYKVANIQYSCQRFLLIAERGLSGAKAVGHLKMLINEQTLPSIMEKMPAADWQQGAINRPTWVKEEVEVAFRKFVE